MENWIGRKLLCGIGRSCELAVDAGETSANFASDSRDDVTTLELCLPPLEGYRRQVVHREHSFIGVLRQESWDRLRHKPGDSFDPSRLLGIALDRRLPVGGNAQLR